MEKAIEISNLGKKYALSHKNLSTTSLRSYLSDIISRPFTFKKMDQEIFWALRNVNFSVARGEVVGIIGKNGAGKSTLLKIISGITKPTEGKVRLWGKTSSLLEVGTGFHPELTGRENIFLNGVLIGMTRIEVAKKFDQIVEFAGIEKFLDTPVKHYSSGMYVRLAFSVAAHLEPEILIIDEVLAVGDIEFQRKCIGKMEEMSKKQERTILLVSHNMHSVMSLAYKCLYLEQGKIKMYGETSDVVNAYLASMHKGENTYHASPSSDAPKITSISLTTSDKGNIHRCGKPLFVEFEVSTPRPIKNCWLSFQVVYSSGMPYAHLWTNTSEVNFLQKTGLSVLRCEMPRARMYAGNYTIKAYLAEPPGGRMFDIVESACPFQIVMFDIQRDFQWQNEACTYIEDGVWSSK